MPKFLDDSHEYTDVAAYFITYHTYGTWLHGDERGSMDDSHSIPGTPALEASLARQDAAARRMKDPAVELNEIARTVTEQTMREVAEHRGWVLHAINVRTNHVHVVITANAPPEKVMNDFKSWSTRRMIEAGVLAKGRRAWVRHGSTKYLWDEKAVDEACQYVVEGQGVDLRKTEPRP